MKLLMLLALFPLSASATELVCTGTNLIYGHVISITMNDANAMQGPTVVVHYGEAGAMVEDSAELDSAIAGGQTYLSKEGVMITIPNEVISDSRATVTVGFSSYDYPYESASCHLE